MDTLKLRVPSIDNGLKVLNTDQIVKGDFALTLLKSDLQSQQSKFTSQHFKILKSGDSIIYFLENGSGRIFQTNPLFDTCFRIDKTIHTGYCFGASTFIYNDTIFSVGGYGFWQLNGSVRYFDKSTKEWSIIPSNYDIEFAESINAITCFDEKSATLCLIYQKVSQEYLEDKKPIKKIEVVFFDLKTKKWSTTFSFENTWADKISDLQFIMHARNGIILNSNKYSKTLLFDLIHNKVFEVDDGFLIKKVQLTNRDSDYFMSWRGDSLIINDVNKKISHSISFKVTEIRDKSIYLTASPVSNFSLHDFLDVIVSFSLFICIVLFVYQSRSKKLNNTIPSSERVSGTYKITNFVSSLTPVELSAFELILKNSLANTRTSVDEINSIAEITTRPYKIQNNIRAEIIGEVNKKFSAFSRIGDLLIMRHRASFDKRYFEYFINDRLLSKFKGYQ